MKSDQLLFLRSVMGNEGAKALSKAVDRCQALESVLLPRSIYSWINNISSIGYEGLIPGIENTSLEFQKSDTGYQGSVSIGELIYNFEDSNVFHVASAVAVSLGVEPAKIEARNLEIEKLGKSIDILIKKELVKTLKKDLDKKKEEKTELSPEDENIEKPKDTDGKEELEKGKISAEAPSGAAEPIAPKPPIQATSVAPKMKAPKIPKIKVTKSEKEHKCSICSKVGFENDVYVGCDCLKDLAKTIKTEGDYLILPNYDSDTILALYEGLGRNE